MRITHQQLIELENLTGWVGDTTNVSNELFLDYRAGEVWFRDGTEGAWVYLGDVDDLDADTRTRVRNLCGL